MAGNSGATVLFISEKTLRSLHRLKLRQAEINAATTALPSYTRNNQDP